MALKPRALSRKTLYPVLIGLMLGLLQTGLFFQFTATFSSSFTTYLMITLCWLLGSALSVSYGEKLPFNIQSLLVVSLVAYGGCALLLVSFPFATELWPLYAILVMLVGTLPGLFFARMASAYPARTLFLLENNGFILGLVVGTVLAVMGGRIAIWIAPAILAIILLALHHPVNPVANEGSVLS